MGQTNTRDTESRAIIRRTQRITGYSESYIEKVLRGDRQNELILKTYMELLEHGDEKENELKMAVRELVPIVPRPPKGEHQRGEAEGAKSKGKIQNQKV